MTSGGKYVEVVEDGNRRVGEMTPSELRQCILDIKSWFQRNIKENGAEPLCKGADDVDFQRCEKTMDCELPDALKTLLEEVNGGLYYMDKAQITVGEIGGIVAKLEGSRAWSAGLVPIYGDPSDSMLVIDTKRNNEVLEWDEDGVGDKVANNLIRFLESYRNDLLGGGYEFVADLGVIEKSSKPARSSHK